jgi:hypothetical protein
MVKYIEVLDPTGRVEEKNIKTSPGIGGISVDQVRSKADKSFDEIARSLIGG